VLEPWADVPAVSAATVLDIEFFLEECNLGLSVVEFSLKASSCAPARSRLAAGNGQRPFGGASFSWCEP
jgi:hypothetical protein